MRKLGFKRYRKLCNNCLLEKQLQYHPPPRKKKKRPQNSVQYQGQINSDDNAAYVITQGNLYRQLKKVCHHCKRTDSEVLGKWGPIYSDTDEDGDEIATILLCLRCYEAEMDRWN